MLYPNENNFNEPILAASQALGVPVAVIKGFIAEESGFNPNSFRAEPAHNDGSYGLMQILYATAKGEGFQGSSSDLFVPANSVYYGTKFLKGLLNQYPNILDAIAAYNMGSPRKAANTTPTIIGIYGKPGPDWVYANQPYVDKVASFIAYYQTFEKPNETLRAQIVDALKKKDSTMQRNLYSPFIQSLQHNPLP